MQIRKIILLTLMLFSLAILVPAQAQEQAWSAYLFSADARQVLRVNQDGAEEVFSLGVTNEGQFINTGISISPDGRLAAFCVIDTLSNPQAYTFIIREIETETNVVERKDAGAGGCLAGDFIENSTQVTVGQVFADAEGNVFSNGGPALFWRVAIIDVVSGEILYELNRDSENAPVTTFYDQSVAILPNAGHRAIPIVFFKALPYVGTEFLDVEGYAWDLVTGSVTLFPEYGIFNSDFSTLTGEVIYPVLDENRPSVSAIGMIPPSNSVLLKQGVDGIPQEVYFNGSWSISRVRFINDGARFLVNLLPAMENTSPDAIGERIAIVGRDGTSTEITIPGIHASYGSTATMLVTSWLDSQESAPFITRLGVIEAGELTEIYRREDNGNFPLYWQIVRVVGN
ncbi:MAG: hypothetical protein RLP44_27650 [Aggregatilineales bacterium]